MIRLDIDNYCQSCPDFKPDVEKYVYGYLNDIEAVNTTIRCEHRDRCRVMVQRLKEELEVTEND